jgi:hypothetical protein
MTQAELHAAAPGGDQSLNWALDALGLMVDTKSLSTSSIPLFCQGQGGTVIVRFQCRRS